MSGMELVFLGEMVPEEIKKCLLLRGNGPTKDGYSWKVHEAVPELERIGYDGVVIIPEPRPDARGITPRLELSDYAALVHEEHIKARLSDVIVVWMTRTPENPGHNSGFQFGMDIDSGKVVFGAPEGAWKTRYLVHWAQELQVPVSTTLPATLRAAVEMIGEGAKRIGGERFVPSLIWRRETFQEWYADQKRAKHRLDDVTLSWSWRIGKGRKLVFAQILHVKLWSEKEQRHKSNEFVVFRSPISVTVLYRRAWRLDKSQVLLVGEFRAPASNETGEVWESPGGSSPKEGVDPVEQGSDECFEETGLRIPASDFTVHGARQMVPTLSAFKAHLLSAMLTRKQVKWSKSQVGVARGVAEDTERTYQMMTTIGDIRRSNLVGWADWGMILHVVSAASLLRQLAFDVRSWFRRGRRK